MIKLGILHPGLMGISIAASAKNSGCWVYWTSEGRSQQTRVRAVELELIDAGTLGNLCRTCDVIVSVCPPHAAEELANQVMQLGFRGTYLDANAISPQRARRMGEMLASAGIDFVDGGIIGGPAWQPGSTWLYLSGQNANRVADCFSAGPLEVSVMDGEIGKASALKMCYSAYTKGTTALVSAVMAAAEELGVREDLEYQWSQGGSDFATQTRERVRRVTAKAWRFEGEMKEIAATLEEAGIPDGFHQAAAEIYHRTAHFKDAPETPSLEEVLNALLQQSESPG